MPGTGPAQITDFEFFFLSVCSLVECSDSGKWKVNPEADLGWQRDNHRAGGSRWQVYCGKEETIALLTLTNGI